MLKTTKPITEGQQIKLTSLMVKVGPLVYQRIKDELKIPAKTPVPRLSKRQATRLISALIREVDG